MLVQGTPVEDHRTDFGLWVKREDLSSPPPGPPFSKMRGVMAHLANRPEAVIGVLDTYHSQAGHAVAWACQTLGKQCVNFYPSFKKNEGPHAAQLRARELGAALVPLQAGRSAVIYHRARQYLADLGSGGYMMPNALKLQESVDETAREVRHTSLPVRIDRVIIPASSGTIAAGVIKGLHQIGQEPHVIVHMGYSRPEPAVREYLSKMSGLVLANVTVVDEGYGYRDVALPGATPPWPCNQFYDLKALRWFLRERAEASYRFRGETLLWNVG
jgi:1-aminocyclopropane-1-carboxylate deaminase/D-cysteine desulfhydrase-like pyridoxal-dependent ACC family enzyme